MYYPFYFSSSNKIPGPVIGPIAGGFIAQTVGTKYIFIGDLLSLYLIRTASYGLLTVLVIAASAGLAAIIGIPFLKESYAPIIRRRLAQASSDPEKVASAVASSPGTENPLQYIWLNLSRPMILLTRSFICFILSLYMALCVHRSSCLFKTDRTFCSS